MATVVHGVGRSAQSARGNVLRQIEEAAVKLKTRPQDAEIIEEGEAYKGKDGKWHMWTRVLI